ncbi:P-loop containing nucleoside triphosphate hydrolase protein [Meira miltonrushii]|uniref:P-loop containing nucleoside triphosphate hydrolase protein n=1 Tax=Meira miltonrushii TaxID=1280837 RepID=A0A316VHW8_9BASI|nr:P-loop containing nucleoside triphosphate hydrolase protein [Meira miltonrushii]PWN36844.1 P-loop containing nucleoside triphosphate hydrolase protein [Meira miltonrushii]
MSAGFKRPREETDELDTVDFSSSRAGSEALSFSKRAKSLTLSLNGMTIKQSESQTPQLSERLHCDNEQETARDSHSQTTRNSTPAAQRARSLTFGFNDLSIKQEESMLVDSDNGYQGPDAIARCDGEQYAERKTAGIIERVKMVNFMCHENLTVDLGPRLNLIIGHNGSGKSAVLTAIVIALGANATSTSRANSLKSFIKEGKSQAVIEITITNKGVDAFQGDVFGEAIIVERIIKAEGGVTWKLKNDNGKTVSIKREEVDKMCEHFCIQVDNPLHVLNQDTARKFLTSAGPKQLYEFFIKGTQLKQLSDDYNLIKLYIDRIIVLLRQKKEELESLKAKLASDKETYKTLEAALSIKNELQQLNNEFVWSQVRDSEKELSDAALSLERSKLEHNTLEADSAECSRDLADCEEEKETLQQESTELDYEKKKLQIELGEVEQEIRSIRSDSNKIDQSSQMLEQQYEQIESHIKDTAERIEKEERDSAGTPDSRRNAQLDRHEQVKREYESIRNQITEAENRLENIEEAVMLNQQKKKDSDIRHGDFSEKLKDLTSQIQELKSAKFNRFSVYGRGITQLVDLVNAEKRWHAKPIGPIGLYIKIIDEYKEWSPVLESVLGQHLNAFCVTNPDDKDLLMKFKDQAQCTNLTIITGSDELFDYSSGEPEGSILTILRVLDIKDEFIKRQLINMEHIERFALIRRRVEGDNLLRERPKNVKLAYSLDLFCVKSSKAGSSSTTLMPFRGPPRLSTDIDEQLNKAIHRESEQKLELEDITQIKQKIEKRLYQLQKDDHEARGQLKELKKQLLRKRNEEEWISTDLQQDQSINITVLRETQIEYEKSRDDLSKQLQEYRTRKNTFEEEFKRLIEKKEDTIRLRRTKEAEQDERIAASQSVNQRKVELDGKSAILKRKLAVKTAEVEEKDLRLRLLQNNYKKILNDAKEYCDEIPSRRKEGTDEILTTTEYQALIDKTKAELNRIPSQSGTDVEALVRQVKSKEAAYVKAVEETKDFKAFTEVLRQALRARVRKWFWFRQHLTLKAKVLFQVYLRKRNFEGKLDFDHSKEELRLRFYKIDTAMVAEDGHKDAQMLSGGEKSFSTICFLLSLWETIGSPLRCLDEYDVFMDAVNRRISTNLLAEAAKADASQQYILLSPSCAQDTAFGDEVLIHRLKDPIKDNNTT